jgi:oligopeptide/dipeptide ABC transporter ATP-binding protein
MSDHKQPIVILEGVSKRHRAASRLRFWRRGGGRALAVDDVSLSIARGEILGLVGETGSGKSTVGRLSLMLEVPTTGRVHFEGVDVTRASGRTLRLMRWHAQLVTADPRAALDGNRTVAAVLASPLRLHERGMSRADRRMRGEDLLMMVGLSPDFAARRVRELLPGQCHRIAIARALAIQPRYLVLDEPTSALDPTIQAQILNLLVAVKERFDLACLFATHDLRLARYMSDRIAVMYLGRVVEFGEAEEIWRQPRHPYTRALIAATGDAGAGAAPEHMIRGEPPRDGVLPPGCAFHTRCPAAGPRCRRERPATVENGGVRVACHLHDGGVEARG